MRANGGADPGRWPRVSATERIMTKCVQSDLRLGTFAVLRRPGTMPRFGQPTVEGPGHGIPDAGFRSPLG